MPVENQTLQLKDYQWSYLERVDPIITSSVSPNQPNESREPSLQLQVEYTEFNQLIQGHNRQQGLNATQAAAILDRLHKHQPPAVDKAIHRRLVRDLTKLVLQEKPNTGGIFSNAVDYAKQVLGIGSPREQEQAPAAQSGSFPVEQAEVLGSELLGKAQQRISEIVKESDFKFHQIRQAVVEAFRDFDVMVSVYTGSKGKADRFFTENPNAGDILYRSTFEVLGKKFTVVVGARRSPSESGLGLIPTLNPNESGKAGQYNLAQVQALNGRINTDPKPTSTIKQEMLIQALEEFRRADSSLSKFRALVVLDRLLLVVKEDPQYSHWQPAFLLNLIQDPNRSTLLSELIGRFFQVSDAHQIEGLVKELRTISQVAHPPKFSKMRMRKEEAK